MNTALPAPLSLQADGCRWRLLRAPRAGAPRLLLLHGTGSSWASWRACIEGDRSTPGLQTDFDLLVPDLPGHGGSTGFADGRASLPRMAQALGALLRTLDWQPQWIAGHSAGAALMAQLVLSGHAPQARGLLAVNGAFEPLPGLLGAVAPALARLAASRRWLPGWVARHAGQERALAPLIASTGSTLDAAGVAHYRALLAQPQHVQGVLDMLASWRLDGLLERLPQLGPPLWLAAGLADRTVPAVQSVALARRLPRASLHALPGLGHLAHEEAPAAVNALLRALRDQAEPACDKRATAATTSAA